MRRRTRRRLWAVALVTLAVVGHRLFAEDIRRGIGASAAVEVPSKSGQLRIATFNLHNFPGKHHDLDLVQRRLLDLDADIIAVQEIRDPGPLLERLPGWAAHLSRGGGRSGQTVGILYDRSTVELVGEPGEDQRLTLGGRLRPAFHAYLRSRTGGPDLHVVVVHLKAFADGIDQRRRQWPMLSELVKNITSTGDGDVVVLGDFNTTGPEGGRATDELAELDAALATAGLRRLAVTPGCSAYWDGSRRDAWKEASLLDHLFIAQLAEAGTAPAVTPVGPCGRHGCEPIRSTDAYPDPDYAFVSDHCPLVLDLGSTDDDESG